MSGINRILLWYFCLLAYIFFMFVAVVQAHHTVRVHNTLHEEFSITYGDNYDI